MKKLACFTLCFMLLLSNCITWAEDGNGRYSHSLGRMKSFGIMKGTPEGDMNEEENIKRSEFAAILIRASNLEAAAESMGGGTAHFSDVLTDHWAAPAIHLAAELNLMVGVGEGKFEPDMPVTYEQVVKSLVCTIGYGAAVKQTDGAWYQAYMAEAARIGVLKGIDSSFQLNVPLTRGQTALLLDNAMQIEVLGIENEHYAVQKGTTLLNRLFDGGRHIGIIDANHQTGLYRDVGLRENEVTIDGYRFNAGETNAAELLGMCVEYYGTEEDGESYLHSVIPSKSKNTTIELNGRDVINSTRSKIEYENTQGSEEEIELASDLSLLYNGKLYHSYPENIFSWPNVKSILIDNDADQEFDVAKLTVSEIQQVERINTYDKKIFLKNNLESGVNVIDTLARDAEVSIETDTGETLVLEDLSQEDEFFQIFTSMDMELVRMIKLTNVVSGMLTGLNQEEGEVEIDGEIYPVYASKTGPSVDFSKLILGSYCAFVLSADGEIVDITEDNTQGNMQYGYIYGIDRTNGIGSTVKLKILKGTVTEQIKERDKYYLVGKDIQRIEICTLADSVKIDNRMYKNVGEMLNFLGTGMVIQYAVNSEGKINRIKSGRQMGEYGNRNFNAEVQVFGGVTRGAFGIDDKTIVFFLPAGTVEDDVQSEMKYASDEYECQGFDETEEGNIAGAMVFQTDIDSDKAVYFNADVPFRVIQAVTAAIDGEGGECLKVSGFENGQPFMYQTAPGAQAYEVLKEAQCGDIFRFARNFRGEIATAQKILTGYDEKKPERLTPDYTYYERKGIGNSQVFGVVTEAEYKELSDYSTEYENILRISTSSDGSNATKYSLTFKESDAPYYYIYDYQKGRVIPADFKDIISSGSTNLESASKVFLYSLNDVVKLVMIVR